MNNGIVVIDNYDSFTYNLVQLVEEISNTPVTVLRNDAFEIEDLEAYSHFILSPGPGVPEEAGKLLEVIAAYAASKKILGVCLGHQAIGQAFGGKLLNLTKVYHGVATPIKKTKKEEALLTGLADTFEAGRYHSWVVDERGFPECLEVTARDEEGQIMAFSHKKFPVKGVQFHPESILSPEGKVLLKNFLTL